MGKEKRSTSVVLNTFVRKYNGVFTTDGKILFCIHCEVGFVVTKKTKKLQESMIILQKIHVQSAYFNNLSAYFLDFKSIFACLFSVFKCINFRALIIILYEFCIVGSVYIYLNFVERIYKTSICKILFE